MKNATTNAVSPPDAGALALLARLREDLDDADARQALAARLDALGPTPVRLHHLLNWLRLAYVRASAPHTVFHARPAGWYVAAEIGERLHLTAERCGRSRHLWDLDHWGSTVVAGQLCFVNEPYSEGEDARTMFRELARLVGGVDAFGMESDWGHGTVRALLFPPGE